MSLIQEALKRQQAEFGDGDKKNPPANLTADNVQALPEKPAGDQPESPVSQNTAGETPAIEPAADEVSQKPAAESRRSVPLPDEPLPAEDTVAPPERRPWLGVVGVSIFGLLILGAAGGLVYLAVSHFLAPAESDSPPPAAVAGSAVESSPAVTAGDDSAPPAQPVESPTVASVPEPPAPADVPPPAPVAQTISRPLKDARQVTEKIAADRAAAEVVQPPPPEPSPPLQPPPRNVVQKKPPPKVEPPKPVKWPALHLTGVLRSAAPGEGAARINNTMVFIGGEIEGVTLMQIQQDGVLLRYQNENRFLRVGATLY